MRWLIIGSENVVTTPEFIEGTLLSFGVTPQDIDTIMTTQRGGIDLCVEEFGGIHEIECNSSSPDWMNHGVNAPIQFIDELLPLVDKALIIWDGNADNDKFIHDALFHLNEDGIGVFEVLLLSEFA